MIFRSPLKLDSDDDFSESSYRELLRLAKNTWRFVNYSNCFSEGRTILWRHDVDISIHRALRLAEIEHEEGVTSTFFLLLHSTFYNLLEFEIVQKVEAIIAMGHAIGLHFDPAFYDGKISSNNQLTDMMELEKKILEGYFCTSITTVSWHNPSEEDLLSMNADSCAGMINAYGARIRKEYAYLSDSNGIWRYRRLRDVLEEGADEKLQVLTHPEWWQKSPMSPRERKFRAVDGRAIAAMRLNDSLLVEYGRSSTGRLDEEFQFLKQKMGRNAELLDYRWMRGESASVFVDLWRMFESQLVKFCRIWLRKILRASSVEVNAVIESSTLRLPMYRVFAAVYQKSWGDVSGVKEEEYIAWQQVRNHLVHGLRTYPRGELEDGIVFLVQVMRRLATFGGTHPIAHDGLHHAGGAGLPITNIESGACLKWLRENKRELKVSGKTLENFVRAQNGDAKC